MLYLLLHTDTYKELHHEKAKLMELTFDHWLLYDLFSIKWWFLFIATVVPYFIWWRFVNKTRFFEIFSYGLLCACISFTLDLIGTEMLLWGYYDTLLPWIPTLVPADLVIIPITAMFMYQFFPKWKTFILATVGWAFMFSYVIEPLFMAVNMFKLGANWKHTYSFIGFIVLGLFLKTIFHYFNNQFPKN